ncbi:hypothetical protein [Oceanobacillus alkalisoli]|uniref:hypothetical protein n=1 Tax=Oceanobacillus alkalisoli TaxID=2925113 RepID=UPI001F1195B4|nr:hypothetical protein [Oceanobacillus alkalisoli]MCF3942805.1 hypothetical protein [Oceanobacillus alkalisoli]
MNNIIGGKMVHRKMLDRSTPYHVPHSTEVAGFAVTYGGDDRFYNNIFIGDSSLEDVGTAHYNGYTKSLEEYMETVNEEIGDLETFLKVEQPVYINNNAYLNGAVPFEDENERIVVNHFNPELRIVEEGNEVYLYCELPEEFERISGEIQTTKTLGKVRIVDADFVNPNGEELAVDTDFLGGKRSENSVLGPIADLQKGKNRVKVWEGMGIHSKIESHLTY